MESETPLGELRRRVGVEAALVGIVSRTEVASGIRPAVERILLGLGETHRLRDLARLTPYGPFAFSRAFREAAGMSHWEFVDRARVDGALLRIATTSEPTARIARDFGFIGVATLNLSIGEYTGLPLPAVLSLLRP